MTTCWHLVTWSGLMIVAAGASAAPPIPDRLVVLTFDDAVRSHFTVVRPLLKQYGFGATFFVTEGFEFSRDKEHYLTWEEIAELHRDGFEIGNHTRDHAAVTVETLGQLAEQLEAINARCQAHQIPRPVSFAYPGNTFLPAALPKLRELGIRLARRGGQPEFPYERGRGLAYEPGLDDPLLIPSAGDARPDWTLDDFRAAVEQAQRGRIAVLQFHGVPDVQHPWVNTSPERFREFMQYLHAHHYRVIALRDLEPFVHPGSAPQDPEMIVRDRQAQLATGRLLSAGRRPANDDDLRRWLELMVLDHGYALPEIAAATELPAAEIEAAMARWKLDPAAPRTRPADRLYVVPYPGGRHPRIGFRDGMLRPQRETKFSVFAPWNSADYVVGDVPEAIWIDTPAGRQLLYLGHTHVPTLWDRQGTTLAPREWSLGEAGELVSERQLPNGVAFGTRVQPQADHLDLEMWISNGTPATISGLLVQNCFMLGRLSGFESQSNDNKLFQSPYVACRDATGNRWVIAAWDPCARVWGNAACPCMHPDPQFPDCPPGETRRLRGWFSFYAGPDIQAELARIEATGWRGDGGKGERGKVKGER